MGFHGGEVRGAGRQNMVEFSLGGLSFVLYVRPCMVEKIAVVRVVRVVGVAIYLYGLSTGSYIDNLALCLIYL